MSKERTLKLPCTQAEVSQRLREHIRFMLPRGKVEYNTFTIYKQPTGFGTKGALLPAFYLTGSFYQTGNETVITYRAKDFPTFYLIFAMLLCGAAYIIQQTIATDKDIWMSIVFCGLVLFYYLQTRFQKRNCIAAFEASLSSDT